MKTIYAVEMLLEHKGPKALVCTAYATAQSHEEARDIINSIYKKVTILSTKDTGMEPVNWQKNAT